MYIPLSRLCRSSLSLAAAFVLLSFGRPARAADINTRNQQIWKLKYGVTDAQLASAAWLALDSDGDGITNGVEIAAGTNPFSASNTIKVSSIARNGTTQVDLTFPTELGKRYRAEATTTLANVNSWVIQPTPQTAVFVTGDGAPKTLTVPFAINNFYRIRVDDLDSDGDGLSDWAERAVNLNPNAVSTVTGTKDIDYVDAQTALPNLVNIAAASPFASEDGPSAGKLTVTRNQNLFPITVTYGVGGTAVPSVDYSALTGSVTLAVGESSKDVFVNPMVQAPAIRGGRSVTATLQAPGGVGAPTFSLGTNSSATVIINSSTVASGTGLLARYYDTASGTQVDAANFGQVGMYAFTRGGSTTSGTIIVTYTGSTLAGLQVGNQVKVSFTAGGLNSSLYNNLNWSVSALTASTFTATISGAPAFLVTSANGSCNFSLQSFTHPALITRVDPTVNFDWQYGTPNGNPIAPNNSPENYSSTWDTYLQPSTTGNYMFQLDADDKARVLLDTGSGLTQIVEHNWDGPATIGTFKQSASIPLVVPATPAQRYHLRVEHVETTGDARCRLQWNVNGGSFVTIPQANQFTHTQALSSYSYTTGNAVIAPSGGHSFSVGNTVALSFSSGTLFTPGVANSYNGTYTITAVAGTFPNNTFTVAITGFPIAIPGATTTAGSPTIAVPSINGLAVGMSVSGTGLPVGEFITAIAPGLISVTTGTGVTAQGSTTITAALPATGTTTGSGFILNSPASTTTGLYNLIYPNTAFNGSPGRVGVDGAVTTGNNGLWGAGTPDVNLINPDTFSIRWTGQVQPQFSEDYTFVVQADDGCTLRINGQPQVLKVSPSNINGGSNYKYYAGSGDLVVTYTSQPVVFGAYSVGEMVRIDPSSGALSHAPTNLPTYSYDSTSGDAVIDYTNLVVGSAGGTRVAGSYAVNEIVELDPISGSASALSQIPYKITAVSGNTFTVKFGAGLFTNGSGNVTVADNRNAVITAVHPAGTYNYNTTTGVTTVSYSSFASVMTGSFAVGNAIDLEWLTGNLSSLSTTTYTITAVDPVSLTFTVTATTGLQATSGAVILRSVPNGITIPASGTTAFTVNIGAGRYASTTNSSINIEIVSKSLRDWSSNGNERYVRIPMLGGVRYDIQLDYWENNSYARCVLSWFSASQPKQVIPAERLYPTSVAQAPPTHLAPTSATALVNGSFSYQVGASNGATVSVSGNPAWLTFSGGVLSGTPPPGAGGDYQIIITTTNAAGTGTSVLNLHVDQNAGTVVRETWNAGGTTVAGIPTGTTPAGTTTLTSLEAPTNNADDYGARIRGYLTAPVSGNYYFWIAANNAGELWISNDDEPVNAQKRAWVTTGNATPRTWTDSVTQKSPWLALEAGHKYYFEILHKAGVGADNLAVGWLKPRETGTVPSEIVPGYALSPFTVLVPLDPGSTIYSAILRPQTGVTTNASGSSFIRLNAAETTAVISENYSGLTSGYFGMHVHDDLIPGGGLANVISDLDQPGDVTKLADGSFQWVIQPRSGRSVAMLVNDLKTGHLYFNVHSTNFPNGEIKGTYSKIDGSQTFTAPSAPPAWSDDSNTSDGAARFLGQATFGANPADIAALKVLAPAGTTNTRYEKWINDQFLIAQTEHLPEVKKREIGDVFGPFDVKVSFNTWWKTSMTAPDQLRQRVAFALSQIHVVSGQGPLEDNSLALSDFYDTLAANAFGNFRDILIGTTLTPAMGRYLDMLRNDKPDLSVGRSPNENYAREIKQLFSIGLYRMWPDGTLILDSQYEPVDTYTQREIVGLAHVFTGWDYGYDGDDHASLTAPIDWTRPMRAVPARHFTGPKRVLNNEVLPGLTTASGQPLDPYATHSSNQYYDATYAALPNLELNAVHDMLFNHPNTGPFVCRQLIQRLVTSNPSKEYLYRVVQKFNDNGSGIRGDMQSVIKAILLDYEARSSALLTVPGYGKQREPIIRVTNAGRAFRPADVSGTYSQVGTSASANTITITTSTPHLLQTGNSVFLEFTDSTPVTAQPAPTAGTYVVTVIDATHYTIPAPGWMTGTYTQSGTTTVTITMNGHWLPGDNANVFPSAQVLPAVNRGQAFFDFTSGGLDGTATDRTVRTVTSSTSYDIASGVPNTRTLPSVDGNYSGSTFTITAADSATRNGNVMISRFPGSYSSTGKGGVITIDTAYGNPSTYGTMADHGLSVGDSVFLNFTNTRDTTSGDPTSTDNDLVYVIASVPDSNTFTVAAPDVANAAMNSDNQVVIFPLKTQPLVRSGAINARQGTFTMDNTDSDLQQTPLNSPTVFNYFLPDYKFAGPLATQEITTPEFQLTSETTVIRQANFFYNGIFNSGNTDNAIILRSSFKTGTNAMVLDLSPWAGNAVNTAGSIGYILGNGALGTGQQIGQVWTSNANLPTLIDRLTTMLLPGQLPAAAKTTMMNFIGRQISSITIGTPCTISMGTAHGLLVGDSVTITGITGGTFNTGGGNGTFVVASVPTTSTLTLTNLNCTFTTTNGGLNLTNSTLGILPYTNASPTTQNIRDRLRAVVHFILTSPDFTIQR